MSLPRAPMRRVTRVLDVEGPRGGVYQVLVLACGCFKTARLKGPPPERAACVACLVRDQVGEQPSVWDLVQALRAAQGLFGDAQAAYWNDRAPDRAEQVTRACKAGFELCLRALAPYPPRFDGQ